MNAPVNTPKNTPKNTPTNTLVNAPINTPMHEQPHEQPADEAGELEPGIGAELMFSAGLALFIAGIGACTATTVALVWSALH